MYALTAAFQNVNNLEYKSGTLYRYNDFSPLGDVITHIPSVFKNISYLIQTATPNGYFIPFRGGSKVTPR